MPHRRPRSVAPGAGGQRLAVGPCAPSSLEPRDVNIFLFTTQIKHWSVPPARDHALKLKITFCVPGIITAPCGVPCVGRPLREPLEDRLLQKRVNQGEHPPIADLRRHQRAQGRMRDGIEVGLEVRIDHVVIARLQQGPPRGTTRPFAPRPGRKP